LFSNYFVGDHTAETNTKAAAACLNFSTFLARLLSGGIAAGLNLCALIRRSESPFCAQKTVWTVKYADLADQVKRYQPYAPAAVPRILCYTNALYELCDKDVRGPGVKWSRAFEAVGRLNSKRFWKTKGLVMQLATWFGKLYITHGLVGAAERHEWYSPEIWAYFLEGR
jgi:hypothetical protein